MTAISISTSGLREGWTRLHEHIGAHHIPGVGTRLVTSRGGWYELSGNPGYLPQGAILTMRPGWTPPGRARAAALKWRVPKPGWMGGAHGPFPTIAEVKGALVFCDWPGMTRWAIERL